MRRWWRELRYEEPMEPAEALARYRAELLEKYESDFVPYTFQVPISVAVGKVTADFRLDDVVVLDEPKFRPHVITENFWRGWEKYRRPTLVSFNGRGFDIPLLGTGRLSLRRERARLVPGGARLRAAAQPLQHGRPPRPVRTADQLRLARVSPAG